MRLHVDPNNTIVNDRADVDFSGEATRMGGNSIFHMQSSQFVKDPEQITKK
jgi:hypothetical protein